MNRHSKIDVSTGIASGAHADRAGAGLPDTARPTVAIFRSNLFRGSETFVGQQAADLQRFRGIYVGRLRQGPAPAGAAAYALEDGRPRWRYPLAAWQMLSRDARGFLRALGAERPALVHAHFGVDGVHALPLARRLGVPLITSFHGFDATLSTAALLRSPAWFQFPLRRAELAREGALFLCASRFIRERVLALGFPPERTRVHYLGVDVGAIAPRSPEEEAPVILHVARLVPVKGTEILLQSFARLAATVPAVELVIIGDGPRRRALEVLAAQLGIAARTRFLGAQPHAEVLCWLRRARSLVLPSVRTPDGRVEGLGLVLLEAAASGVPMLGSRVGGIPEVIRDGETGWLVPERDVEALADRLAALLADDAGRRRMGAAARRQVEQDFDRRRQMQRLETLYDEVLTRHDEAHVRHG